MRTSFITGFIKAAVDNGCSEEQASILLKRALEHPEAKQLFVNLAPETGMDLSSSELEALAELQDRIESGAELGELREALDLKK